MNLAVLVSGTGTNLRSLLAAEAGGRLAPGRIACVVSNRPGVGALAIAEGAGKPALVVDHKAHASREAFEAALGAVLAAHHAQALVLAGFMRLLTAAFLERWPGRVINIHPSLLPAFPGVDAQRQALEHGVKVTGCTVHLVSAAMDAGPIILQAAVTVEDGDTVDTLRARILEREHELLPRAAQLLAAGKLRVDGRRVRIIP